MDKQAVIHFREVLGFPESRVSDEEVWAALENSAPLAYWRFGKAVEELISVVKAEFGKLIK
jgi:hypothetical protein